MNRTTIEITEKQRDELEELKAHPNEPVRDVVKRLLTDGDAQATVELSPDVREQLDRIEAAAKEATQTAQDTQHTLEGLQ